MKNADLEKFFKKEITRKEFLKVIGIVFVTLFGVTAVIEEILSHAASPYASQEAESGTLSSGATKVANSSASGGNAVQFGTTTSSILGMRGVIIPVFYLDTYASSGFTDLLPQIAADGFDYVVLNPYPYLTSASNPTVAASNQTATIASMITAIQAIQANGMKAVFKTTANFVDGTDAETYTGTGGDNGAAFFNNYIPLLVSYAQMCQTYGVAHMEVCYEMDSLARANPTGYRNLISTVRQTFKGTITYGATGFYYGDITFWDACDFIGVHGYFDLVPAANANTSNTNVAAMVAYLSNGTQSNGTNPPIPTLAALSAKYGKKVLITETGFLSVVGCAYQPYNSANAQPGSGHATSQPDQAAAIQAIITAYTPQPWCAGFFYWAWDTIGETVAQQVNDYTPHGKSGELVLRDAWT